MLVDLKPTGEGYMEDFHAAGGMPALLWELRDLLHLDDARRLRRDAGEQLVREPPFVDRRYIRARGEPVSPVGGLVALFGSLAPRRRDPEAQRGDAGAVRDRGALPWCSTGWRTSPTASTIRRWT